MTFSVATHYLSGELRSIYSEGEATTITRWVMEHIAGNRNTTVRDMILNQEQVTALQTALKRLLNHEPVQYVLNESWFCGLKFHVDPSVLIPRPETEELVEWIISNCRFPVSELKILDIGTGSGCIPISLKRRIRKAEVWAIDKSEEALATARKNAAILGTEVKFLNLDILDSIAWTPLPVYDIIVSNPPYVPAIDKMKMDANVLDWEPHSALFVPDNDPLVFYDAIAELSKEHLGPAGHLYFEIHENLGSAVMNLLKEKGFQPELKKDMQQKERMVRAVKR